MYRFAKGGEATIRQEEETYPPTTVAVAAARAVHVATATFL